MTIPGLPESWSSWQPLDRRLQAKPLDCGNGLLAASVDAAGGVQAIVLPDADLGVLVLDTQPPFADAERHDAAAVRAYRASLAGGAAPAVGLRAAGGWDDVEPGLLGGLLPASRLRAGPVEAWVVTAAVPGRTALVQWWCVTTDRAVERWPYRFEGSVHLTRAALTQLTEGGVLPLPAATARAALDGDVLVLTSSRTERAAALAGLGPVGPFAARGPGPLELRVEGARPLSPAGAHTLQLVWAVADSASEAAGLARTLAGRPIAELLPPAPPPVRGGRAGPLVSRARSYVTDCCALALRQEVCLLTDHRILPLSWTRDAYWAARMLLDDGDPAALDTVRRHLLWLFEVAERPDATWGRAHLPNGAVKDPAFQLDQQCYPLLELAEYALETGDATTARRLAPAVDGVLAALERRRDDGTGLYPTQETPADDPLPLPFHCSSHVLLWRTFERLADAAPALGLQPAPLRAAADRLRAHTLERFAMGAAGERRLAYAVDGRGGHLDYHDANDLPTAFAPLWGWCAADDPLWRRTMEVAFSAANRGWAEGPRGGLGSVHTPGAWPLGDVQEYVVARLTGGDAHADHVLDRLVRTACVDGALPEARSPRTGEVRSRHWFAWPGAALAVALVRCPAPATGRREEPGASGPGVRAGGTTGRPGGARR